MNNKGIITGNWRLTRAQKGLRKFTRRGGEGEITKMKRQPLQLQNLTKNYKQLQLCTFTCMCHMYVGKHVYTYVCMYTSARAFHFARLGSPLQLQLWENWLFCSIWTNRKWQWRVNLLWLEPASNSIFNRISIVNISTNKISFATSDTFLKFVH